MDVAKTLVKTESSNWKLVIAATGVGFGVLSLIFMSLYFARFASVMVW